MDKEKLMQFLVELNKLESKYGISIKADAIETIDYGWNEDPYVSGATAHLVFVDEGDIEMTLDDLDIDDLAEIERRNVK